GFIRYSPAIGMDSVVRLWAGRGIPAVRYVHFRLLGQKCIVGGILKAARNPVTACIPQYFVQRHIWGHIAVNQPAASVCRYRYEHVAASVPLNPAAKSNGAQVLARFLTPGLQISITSGKHANLHVP